VVGEVVSCVLDAAAVEDGAALVGEGEGDVVLLAAALDDAAELADAPVPTAFCLLSNTPLASFVGDTLAVEAWTKTSRAKMAKRTTAALRAKSIFTRRDDVWAFDSLGWEFFAGCDGIA